VSVNEFEREVLRALVSMGDEEPVPTDYLATRLGASEGKVEGALQSLSDADLVEAETDVAEMTHGPAHVAERLYWRTSEKGRKTAD
jgi:predicted transcriptional regulator